MYNNIKYLIIAGFAGLGLSSCSKSFLDKTPASSANSANYFTNPTAAENGLTGCYRALVDGNFYQYDNPMNTDGRSDNCYVNGDNTTAEQPLENFTFTSSNTNVQRDWEELYGDIADCNLVLNSVPLITDGWSSDTRKLQILGEASFLRAMAYYWLVTEWGDCPLITTVTNNGDFVPARSPASVIYAQIVADLKYADSVLPATPYNSEYGRATQGAAEALLAKTYAQMGDYTNCLTYANKVINSGTYSLVPDFANLWGSSHKNNAEAIFEMQFPGSTYSFWGVELFAYVSSDGWPKRDIGSYDLIQAFKAAGDTTGSRYTATFNWQIANAAFNMPLNAWDYQAAIPFMNKWPDPSGWNSTDNITLLRLADIILLAAEANNQLGNTSDAITQLNKVRSRAGLAGTTASSQGDLGTAILNERRLELVHECMRWNDLLRAEKNGYVNVVNLMNSQVNSYGANLNYNMNSDKHQYIFPIPLEDMLLNKNLTQNDGY